MTIRRITGILCFVLVLFSCDGGGNSDNGSPTNSGLSSSGKSISGQVVDDAGLPVGLATVSAYGVVSQSGADGKFTLTGITSIPARIVVQADKEGFFPATVGSLAGSSETPFILVSLARKQLLGVVSNGTGGELGTGSIKIKCQSESFAGNVTDTIAVYTSYVDPTSGANTAKMPGGDFTAIGASSDTGSMVSFGAMQIAVETKSGNPVAIKMPLSTCLAIPSSMAATAPDTIPLWTMGSNGVWKSFGVAKKSGGAFCFETPTAGAFNCDLFSRTVQVQGKVCRDTLKNPAPFDTVRIGQILTASGSDGRYSVLVPAVATIVASCRFGTGSATGVGGKTVTLDLGCSSPGTTLPILGAWTRTEGPNTDYAAQWTNTYLADGTGWEVKQHIPPNSDTQTRKNRILWTYTDTWLVTEHAIPDTEWVSNDNGVSWTANSIDVDVTSPSQVKVTFQQGVMVTEEFEDGQDKPATLIEQWSRP